MLLKLVLLVTLTSALGAYVPSAYTTNLMARLGWPYSSYYYSSRLVGSKGYVAPVVASKGAVVSPVVTSKGAVVSPLVTSKGAVVSPVVTSKGAVVAPLVSSKGTVARVLASKGAVAPLVTSKGAMVSPYMFSSKGSAARILMTTKGGYRYSYPSVCLQEKQVGICTSSFKRFYYNKDTGSCEEFAYSGCGKNANNFFTEAACKATCGAMPLLLEAPAPLCMRPTVEGTCTDFSARWYYNSGVGSCMMFVYSGCGTNGNNFETEEECENTCPNVPVCKQEKHVGTCWPYTGGYIPRYYYNEETESCDMFLWGGCSRNSNNFLSKFSCELQCMAAPKEENPVEEEGDAVADE